MRGSQRNKHHSLLLSLLHCQHAQFTVLNFFGIPLELRGCGKLSTSSLLCGHVQGARGGVKHNLSSLNLDFQHPINPSFGYNHTNLPFDVIFLNLSFQAHL